MSRRSPRQSRPALGPQAASFIVVTGQSGAGKSQVVRALEDLGYFCVDNLPIALIPAFADIALGERPAAVVVDIREGRELLRFPAVYQRLKRRAGSRIRLIFLEAADAAILRRFSETRRPHPLGREHSLVEGIKEERRLLKPIRRLADQVVDTSALTVHELRRLVIETAGESQAPTPLVVTVTSFGFRGGVPPDANMVLDVRFLPNPHFVPVLRRWTGKNARVARYVLRSAGATRFLKLTDTLLKFLVPQYIAEGKTYLTIAIGCTGGKHRSVALTEAIAKRLKRIKGIQVRTRHRDAGEW